jgi:hypothetical protein
MGDSEAYGRRHFVVNRTDKEQALLTVIGLFDDFNDASKRVVSE